MGYFGSSRESGASGAPCGQGKGGVVEHQHVPSLPAVWRLQNGIPSSSSNLSRLYLYDSRSGCCAALTVSMMQTGPRSRSIRARVLSSRSPPWQTRMMFRCKVMAPSRARSSARDDMVSKGPNKNLFYFPRANLGEPTTKWCDSIIGGFGFPRGDPEMDLCRLLVSRRDTPMWSCRITPSFSWIESMSTHRNLASLSVVLPSLTPRTSGTKYSVVTLSRYPNKRRRMVFSSLRSPVWGAGFGCCCVVASMVVVSGGLGRIQVP